MRKIDGHKLSTVFSAIASSDGIWVRQISRTTGLPVSTVHYYIGILEPLLDETRLEPNMLRILKVKASVLEQMNRGKSIAEILKKVRLVKDALNF